MNESLDCSGFGIWRTDVNQFTVAMIAHDLNRCVVDPFSRIKKNGLKRQFLIPEQILVGNLTSFLLFEQTLDFTSAKSFQFFVAEQYSGKTGSTFEQFVLLVEGEGFETYMTDQIIGIEEVA